MQIFLSGGTGFIGKNLKTLLNSHQVSAPSRAELDLSDLNKVENYFSPGQFDAILHTASTGVARGSIISPVDAFHINLKSFAAIQHQIPQVKKFINFGSGAEYAKPLRHKQIHETQFDEVVPSDPYGLAKYLIAKNLQDHSPAQVINLRFFGVFGPYEDYHTRFISNAILYALCDLPITINKDVVFDYIYIEDVARILECFLEQKADFTHYNMGSGMPLKLSEIAEIVKSLIKTSHPIIIKDKELGSEYSPNIDRLKDFLGKSFAFTPIEIAITKLMEWYKVHFNEIAPNFLKDKQ